VTIQTVSLAADLVMLLAAAALIALAVAIAVRLVQRRPRSAARLGFAAGALVVVYGATLVAAGLAGGARQLRPGDTKCFDDWCASMVAARRDAADTLLVEVRLENRGRGRAMRADLARAYLEVAGGGQVAPRDGSGLQTLLEPGERADVPLSFPAPADLRGARFVVVEGGGGLGPGTFEIGGESSPFHGVAGWPL
jgi:hypothetical protein